MNLTETSRFFIVYPLLLEDLGLLELEEKFKLHFASQTLCVTQRVPGGIEIECPLAVGLNLNKILRTPTRILLRLGEFKCRDAPKLYQKISKFNWAPWLIGQSPEIVSSAVNSRLFDSRKIEKAISDGVAQYYRHKPVKKKYLEHFEHSKKEMLPKIYFRSVDDVCTISLDTTGERLHLRGDKILSGHAPIRESLAALLLTELQTHLPDQGLYSLVDPMCGSGTFLIEAADSFALTSTREFSFSHLPVVLDHPEMLKLENIEGASLKFKALYGFDQDPEVIKQATQNCKDKSITIARADLFDQHAVEINEAVVILNPPYGVRVGEKSEINLPYYLKIIENIRIKFHPVLLGIIVPSDYRILSNSTFKVLSARPFKNGGLEVVFYVLAFK